MPAPYCEYNVYKDATCLAELYKFRYRIYVDEMNRTNPGICHKTRTIKDALDLTGHQAIVTKADEIIACMRINFASESDLQPYSDFYELDLLPGELKKTVFLCTFAMVARSYRNTLVFGRMLQTAFGYALNNGARICYVNANEPYASLYRKLGTELVMKKVHPDYGEVAIMRLDAYDYERLRAVRSPLASITKRFLERQNVLEPA